MDRPFVRLTLPASIDSLPNFLEFAHAGAQAAELTPEDRDRLDLVLEELLVNVARYAYQPGTGEVELAYAVDHPGSLLVEISDNGRDFNPLENKEPELAAALQDRQVGGLGVFLARRLAASFAYRREHGRNTVSFRFSAAGDPVS